MEKWMIKNIKYDITAISKSSGIGKITTALLLNRGINSISQMRRFINPDINDLCDPSLLKDAVKAVTIIKNKILNNKKIRIVGDYDVDGVISTYILYKGLIRCGAAVDYYIPHRIYDGYGINKNIIDACAADGVDTIVTCDNGISQTQAVSYAKSLNMTVIITDHHNIPFTASGDIASFIIPEADAVIDAKQADCKYPFKDLCGAGIAYKFIFLLYEAMSIDQKEAYVFLEYVSIATICDIVSLTYENRIIVKYGLEMLSKTQNTGLKALIKHTGIEGKKINVYHVGFILGPCINASGRLDYAKKALELLLTQNPEEADLLAGEISELNNERKNMTKHGFDEIVDLIEKKAIKRDKVLVIYKNDIHESIAGIVAGRLKEKYNTPAIVLTDGDDCAKGSGRSTEKYNMFEELTKCKDLLIKFGGHPMAAGLTLDIKNIPLLKEKLNKNASLTEDDLIPKIIIDIQLPINKITIPLVDEIGKLEPFGKDNPKPLFAEKNVKLSKAVILGSNKNVLKLFFAPKHGGTAEAVFFGDIGLFKSYLTSKYGISETDKLFSGTDNGIKLDIIYSVGIDEYMGHRKVRITLEHYK